MRAKAKVIRKKRACPESVIQKNFFLWLRWAYPKLYPLAFAIPNGGLRNIIVAKKLKAEGVKAGVPDIFIAHAFSVYHGLFIEFKAGRNKPTKDQEEMIKKLRDAGYVCNICYSLEHAIDTVHRYVRGLDNILLFKGDKCLTINSSENK